MREGQRKRCGCSQAGDVIGAAVFCLGLSVLVLPKTLLRGASAKGLLTYVDARKQNLGPNPNPKCINSAESQY